MESCGAFFGYRQSTIPSSSTQLIYNSTGFTYTRFDNYQILQEFYDHVFPGLSCLDIQFDVYDVNVVQPLSLILENMVVDVSRTRYSVPVYDKVRPVLRTLMHHHRPNMQIETLLAMVKRNLNIPGIQGNVDQEVLADMMIESFLKTYIDKDKTYMLKQFQHEYPMQSTAFALWDWFVNAASIHGGKDNSRSELTRSLCISI